MDKKEIQRCSTNTIETTGAVDVANQGRIIMNQLESLGIKEASFENGGYFRSKGEERVLVKEGFLLAETDTEYQIRVAKDDVESDRVIKASEFKPTQKMIGAYVGKSQSTVSQKRIVLIEIQLSFLFTGHS